MFNIDPVDPTCLQLVGRPVSTLGDFPVAVAYSPHLRMACVVNGGAKDGVTCFSVDAAKGLDTLDTAPRPFNIGQSTPPSGPLGTVSDIFFAPDNSSLIVT